MWAPDPEAGVVGLRHRLEAGGWHPPAQVAAKARVAARVRAEVGLGEGEAKVVGAGRREE